MLDRVGRGQNRVIRLIAPQVGAFPRCRALKPLRAPNASATSCDGVPSLVDRLPWVAVTPPTPPALRNSLNRNVVRRRWFADGLSSDSAIRAHRPRDNRWRRYAARYPWASEDRP